MEKATNYFSTATLTTHLRPRRVAATCFTDKHPVQRALQHCGTDCAGLEHLSEDVKLSSGSSLTALSTGRDKSQVGVNCSLCTKMMSFYEITPSTCTWFAHHLAMATKGRLAESQNKDHGHSILAHTVYNAHSSTIEFEIPGLRKRLEKYMYLS